MPGDGQSTTLSINLAAILTGRWLHFVGPREAMAIARVKLDGGLGRLSRTRPAGKHTEITYFKLRNK